MLVMFLLTRDALLIKAILLRVFRDAQLKTSESR